MTKGEQIRVLRVRTDDVSWCGRWRCEHDVPSDRRLQKRDRDLLSQAFLIPFPVAFVHLSNAGTTTRCKRSHVYFDPGTRSF